MARFGFFALVQPWTLENWTRTPNAPVFERSIRNTLVLACAAASIGAVLFSVVAWIVVRARGVWGRGLLDLILWMPSVIPGALAGLGLLWMLLGTSILTAKRRAE